MSWLDGGGLNYH